MALLDNGLIREGIQQFRHRLPPGWRVSEPVLQLLRSSSVGAATEVQAPNGPIGRLLLDPRPRLDPKGVRALVDANYEESPRTAFIVIARYLSKSTRDHLRERDIGYLDLTGNVRIVLQEPGLFIETQGASEDPDRTQRPARTLRGAKAGRVVRALIDRKAPPGVRELAILTRIDAGYVSRVLALLDTESLITRVGHGRIQRVDWPALLRRWAREAPLESRGQLRTYLEPRGLTSLLARLATLDERYAVTGSLAATPFSPITPARLGVVWVCDANDVAGKLGLRIAETGGNVLLIEPGDEGVFEGATKRDDVWYAALSQVAADLLTSPGRGPAEGEQLIDWMLANEKAWRQ